MLYLALAAASAHTTTDITGTAPHSVRGTTTDITAASALRQRNAAAGVPLPSQAQLSGTLQHQFTLFMHWSMCTFTGCQWNLATSPAQDFAPPDAGPNATQWALTAKLAGATQICLTVRHVGGFALWPTASTNYSVANSTWRGGKGDVVLEFVTALRAVGISPCLYIILGFNVEAAHANVSGPAYLERQVTALTELLTNYGHVDRLWWDNYRCARPPAPWSQRRALWPVLTFFPRAPPPPQPHTCRVQHWVLPARAARGLLLRRRQHHLNARAILPWLAGAD